MSTAIAQQRHIPGESGIWLFIIGDLLMYGALFLLFAHARGSDLVLFNESQRALSPGFGIVNTLILLTSSWFVVKGVQAARKGQATPRWFGAAILCGAAFGLSKIIEYTLKIEAGLVLTTNDFFMYYYLLTAFHFLHVLIGMVVLWFMRGAAVRPRLDGGGIRFLESGATFWHLVDLLWILIFPLLYLMH